VNNASGRKQFRPELKR